MTLTAIEQRAIDNYWALEGEGWEFDPATDPEFEGEVQQSVATLVPILDGLFDMILDCIRGEEPTLEAQAARLKRPRTKADERRLKRASKINANRSITRNNNPTGQRVNRRQMKELRRDAAKRSRLTFENTVRDSTEAELAEILRNREAKLAESRR